MLRVSAFSSLLLVPQLCTTDDPFAFLQEEEDEYMDCIDDESESIQDVVDTPQQKMFDSIDDFDVQEVIGVGSYGKVFYALHQGTPYALKVISRAKIRANPSFSRHHAMELAILRTLGCPFAAQCHGIIHLDEHVVIVEEFVPGGELYYHIQKHRNITEDQARFYAAELVVALEFLKEAGVLFRDLKPENLMLDAQGHLKLIDFGLSTLVPPTTDDPLYVREVFARTFCGTAEYLAPEVIQGNYYGMAVDIWGLGCVLYEILTGYPPFYSNNQQTMFHRILHEPLRTPANFSSDLTSLLSVLLQKDWRKRPSLNNIQNHAWFKGIDWRQVRRHGLTPPFVPTKGETQRQAKFIDAADSDVRSSFICNRYGGGSSSIASDEQMHHCA